mmetsp:Transcript_23465/g.52739  ORF Transcript_23465/g.52739 Transcript_23465/m.52739 type:complete len:240 (-) Transcript_23465:206-925(-)
MMMYQVPSSSELAEDIRRQHSAFGSWRRNLLCASDEGRRPSHVHLDVGRSDGCALKRLVPSLKHVSPHIHDVVIPQQRLRSRMNALHVRAVVPNVPHQLDVLAAERAVEVAVGLEDSRCVIHVHPTQLIPQRARLTVPLVLHRRLQRRLQLLYPLLYHLLIRLQIVHPTPGLVRVPIDNPVVRIQLIPILSLAAHPVLEGRHGLGPAMIVANNCSGRFPQAAGAAGARTQYEVVRLRKV